ncbi:hypothetical protein Poly51_25320 [Rubripirellula tenax]|uniref:Uncharacterized protein n=1 Tax=Rubripirellula tenax TaxID=2528015 RepID=A0A5C6F8Z8_9BACT|nr:hypothetical protein Poly51_25320 [Rubripirellula tenax]
MRVLTRPRSRIASIAGWLGHWGIHDRLIPPKNGSRTSQTIGNVLSDHETECENAAMRSEFASNPTVLRHRTIAAIVPVALQAKGPVPNAAWLSRKSLHKVPRQLCYRAKIMGRG